MLSETRVHTVPRSPCRSARERLRSPLGAPAPASRGQPAHQSGLGARVRPLLGAATRLARRARLAAAGAQLPPAQRIAGTRPCNRATMAIVFGFCTCAATCYSFCMSLHASYLFSNCVDSGAVGCWPTLFGSVFRRRCRICLLSR